jgi:hypothetical protein
MAEMKSSAILNTGLQNSGAASAAEQLQEQLGVAHPDWARAEMVAYLGQTAKAGDRSPSGEMLDGASADQEVGDLAAVERFFAGLALPAQALG